ncbi:glycine-rich cell wall structural protein 1.8-like [Vombatus ursinus]|uniref:glycine-rich cell wall structural protein 1.8-like n=1 Tax=Vombatus ursinus TaxID=29139 RepID=UPI000FFCEB04|nr:glycine-rich cell wall structural protein 1.8-like [Vombatus ursinus]
MTGRFDFPWRGERDGAGKEEERRGGGEKRTYQPMNRTHPSHVTQFGGRGQGRDIVLGAREPASRAKPGGGSGLDYRVGWACWSCIGWGGGEEGVFTEPLHKLQIGLAGGRGEERGGGVVLGRGSGREDRAGRRGASGPGESGSARAGGRGRGGGGGGGGGNGGGGGRYRTRTRRDERGGDGGSCPGGGCGGGRGGVARG